MNHSVLSKVPSGSLALTHKSAVDPFIFMDRKEPEIIHRLPKEYEYTEAEAGDFFQFQKEILKKLKSLRRCKIKTSDYLDEIIKDLPVKIKLFTILFLIKALEADDSWMHAYNCLVQLANRDLPRPMDYKYMPEHELMALINEDDEDPLIFNEALLERFYFAFRDGFLWRKASMDVFKGWFRINPVGKPDIEAEMITYFCYAIGEINRYRLVEICPNIEDWYSALTGKKTTFSKLKGSAVGKNKTEVDRRIALLTHSLNG